MRNICTNTGCIHIHAEYTISFVCYTQYSGKFFVCLLHNTFIKQKYKFLFGFLIIHFSFIIITSLLIGKRKNSKLTIYLTTHLSNFIIPENCNGFQINNSVSVKLDHKILLYILTHFVRKRSKFCILTNNKL